MKSHQCVSFNGGFFYRPDEAIYHSDRGQRMLECGQIIRKVTDQRRSVIRTGPAGSDKARYVTQVGLHRPGLTLVSITARLEDTEEGSGVGRAATFLRSTDRHTSLCLGEGQEKPSV